MTRFYIPSFRFSFHELIRWGPKFDVSLTEVVGCWELIGASRILESWEETRNIFPWNICCYWICDWIRLFSQCWDLLQVVLLVFILKIHSSFLSEWWYSASLKVRMNLCEGFTNNYFLSIFTQFSLDHYGIQFVFFFL